MMWMLFLFSPSLTQCASVTPRVDVDVTIGRVQVELE